MWQNIILSIVELTYPSTADLTFCISTSQGASLYLHIQFYQVVIKYIFKDVRKGSTWENIYFFISLLTPEHLNQTI